MTDGKSRPVIQVCEWIIQTPDLFKLATTILHEVLHIVDNRIIDQTIVGEPAYGPDQCMKLARKQGKEALLNADSYVHFLLAVFEEKQRAAQVVNDEDLRRMHSVDLNGILRRRLDREEELLRRALR